jgi:hypothetical protein
VPKTYFDYFAPQRMTGAGAPPPPGPVTSTYGPGVYEGPGGEPEIPPLPPPAPAPTPTPPPPAPPPPPPPPAAPPSAPAPQAGGGGPHITVTRAAAQQYFNSRPYAEQQKIKASWGGQDLLLQWFQNAVNAGVPGAVKAAGGKAPPEPGWEIPGGAIFDPTGKSALPPSAWWGKRNPSPTELRRWALEGGQTEDYMRYSDRQVAAWIREGWDTARGGWKPGYGEHGKQISWGRMGRGGGGGGRGRGGGGGGAGGFDYGAFMSLLMPLLTQVYGPTSASGSYLPGTSTQLDSSLPFSPWFG